MTPAQTYYTTPGPFTQPGHHSQLLDNLPTDLPSLVKVVQGLMVHIFWAEAYGLKLNEQRQAEVQLRPVTAKLDRLLELDPRPLTEARPPERRLVGNCRDFSITLTALLQHQGIPARARCGFGRYFIPNHYEDHWVCEYWNAEQSRWILVDAQLDELQCNKLSIQFDPLDTPRDQFIVGGHAWQLCRTGQVDPDSFGIFDMKGLGFVLGDFVRDIASLNQIPLLPWDCWGIMFSDADHLATEDLAWLDNLATLTCRDVPDFDRLRTLYETDSRVRVPTTITSFTQAGPQQINLDPFLNPEPVH